MPEHHAYGPAHHVTWTSVDAVFRMPNGAPAAMHYHSRQGPTFYDRDGKCIQFPPKSVWKQFNGWWAAKGALRYTGAPGKPFPKDICITCGDPEVDGACLPCDERDARG